MPTALLSPALEAGLLLLTDVILLPSLLKPQNSVFVCLVNVYFLSDEPIYFSFKYDFESSSILSRRKYPKRKYSFISEVFLFSIYSFNLVFIVLSTD